jgi:hypothetical protein
VQSQEDDAGGDREEGAEVDTMTTPFGDLAVGDEFTISAPRGAVKRFRKTVPYIAPRSKGWRLLANAVNVVTGDQAHFGEQFKVTRIEEQEHGRR